MNRLVKKCFIASAGLHLLLMVILFVGPAFVSSSSKTEDIPILTFIPVITTDENVSGGGNPRAQSPPLVQPAPPTPVVRQPAPQPQVKPPPKQPEPEPRKEVPEPAPRTRKVEISTTVVNRNAQAQTAAQRRQAAEARERAEEQRRAAAQVGSTISGIRRNLSESTSIELSGPGGDGLPYANWLQAVKKVYTDAWIVPDSITDDSATVTVSITIARDGKVLGTRITRRSGNSTVDYSVQAALDRVPKAPPLPADSKDSERTVTINFNLKAKQLLG